MDALDFINFTPHPITIRLPDVSEIVVETSGKIARVETEEEVVNSLNGIPIIKRRMGRVILPQILPSEEGRIRLVSSMVLEALKGHKEVFYAPDTGNTAIRDAKGQVVAVTRLVRN